jgi:hypothetical protein
MQAEPSRGILMAVVAAAVVLVIGLGWWFLGGQHMPSRGNPAGAKPPPGGYAAGHTRR